MDDCADATNLEKEDSTATAVQEVSPPPAGRYEFLVPEQHMLDLMAVQLGECTRIVRTFADDVVDKPYTASEVSPIVQAFHTVVQSSAIVADVMDLIHYGRQRAMSPAPRKRGTS
ncbi:MAG TPA: hypothetical protein VGM17_00345 [Rhizomicrobium sp.]|jgi:hypothetical protein